MATIIDALIVTLGLNAQGFMRGSQEVDRTIKRTSDESGRASRQMEANSKHVAASIGRVRNEALALLGVFTAGMGLKAFTANTIQGAAGLGLMASNLNTSTERLQAWQRAAERAGGSAAGITGQLRESASQVAKFQRGMAAESLPGFFQFGGRVEDLKDGNTYLLARSRIISELYKTDRARAALAAQMMGIGDEQFDLLRQGPAAVQQLLAAQEKRSSISKKDAEDALRLRNTYLDLRDTFTATGTRILVSLIPALERLLAQGQKLGDYFLRNREQIGAWITRAVDGIGRFVEQADKAAQAVGGWTNVLIALGSLKVLSMTAPLFMVAQALASIGASLGVIGGAGAAAGIAALGTVATVAGGVTAALYSRNLNQGEGRDLDALSNPAMRSRGATDAVRFFESRGYTREQAAGLVANLLAESNLNPRAVGDGGQAVGIAQWHPVRQADFKRAFGKDLRDASVEEQLAFVDWELRNTERTAMRKLQEAQTPQQAGAAVSRYYERPKDVEGEAAKRAASAGAVYAAAHRAQMEAAAGAAANVAAQAAPSAAAVSTGPSTTTNDNSSEININGPVTIQTQATDAQGMARDLAGFGSSQSQVQQSNTGLF